jgi:PKD domain
MSWRARMLGMVAALSVGGAWFAASAHAAGWVDLGPVSPAGAVATSPELTVTPNGTRVVAWIAHTATPALRETVSVSVAPPGGPFGPVQTFPGNGFVLRQATGTDGTAALAWFGDADTIHVAHLAPGATTFTEATPVPIPAGEVPIDIRLAVTSGGEAVTVVSAFGQDGSGIWVHSLARDASTLQLVPGSATGGAVDHGSFDAMGHGSAVNGGDIVTSGADVYVAWQQIASGATPQAPQPITVKTAKRLIGGPAGRFNPPIPIETIQQAGFVSTETLLAAGGGHVYLTWHRPDTQGRGVIGYTDLTLPDTVHVISTDPDPNLAFAAADGGGTLIVTGSADPSGTRDSLVYAAVVAPGAASATAVELTPPGPVRGPEALAVAPDGNALILPDRIPDSEGQLVQIQASHRAPGGSFGPIEDVSGVRDGGGGSNNAAVAIGPDGTELSVWLVTDADGTLNDRIHLSQRDAMPPQFTAVTVPSTVAVGAALRLTASATDLLTGPASIRWDFGDGSQATGNTVSHAYGSPGVHTITVTATDTAGNSVTQTRRVVVRATDVPPPVVSHVAFTPVRFKVARGSTASVAAAPHVRRGRTSSGSTLSLTLNVRATIVVDVRRGRRRIGELVRLSVPPGRRRLVFTGRLDGQALAPGQYAATVTAVDAARRRSRQVNASFTIVSR